MSPRPILTVEEFYAHAIAIEREAVQRCHEFEAYYADRGDEVLAGLCRNLWELENEHLDVILKASEHLEIPAIDAASHQWLEAGSPEPAARELFYRVVNKRQLLEVALQSECNALGFCEWVAHTAPDEAVRMLARDMAHEEMEHVSWVRNALDYHPAPRTDRHAELER